MGSSTIALQDVVDVVATIPDLTPVLKSTSGYASEPACTIATAVMTDLVSRQFNFKWNSQKVAPFVTNGNQSDYPTAQVTNIGWLENAAIVDQNNTSFPKPAPSLEVVREIAFQSLYAGTPAKICWLPNYMLELGVWPGPVITYINPLGLSVPPNNPLTNFQDVNGNILSLVTYGTTGLSVPSAPAASAPGLMLTDGTVTWVVCDPNAAGFRLSPMPAAQSNLWTVRVFAQAKPVRFTSLAQTLAPLPDDYSKWFIDGFIAYARRHSPDPKIQGQWMEARATWMQEITEATRQADRERENFGFYPSQPIMDAGYGFGLNAGNPYPTRRIY